MLRSIIRCPIASSKGPLPMRQYSTRPPTYFADHLPQSSSSKEFAPSPQNMFSPTRPLRQNQSGSSDSSYGSSDSSYGSSRFASIRDLSVVISILSLTYFAIDNYRTRILLEQKIMDQSLQHMKNIAVAQNKFNTHRKKRELQVLNERKATQKREMKMVYHIALLRKQLLDAGLTPVEIEKAISEFEKNVKMETAISNVSGTALWVVDESPMKGYAPNVHDYENKK